MSKIKLFFEDDDIVAKEEKDDNFLDEITGEYRAVDASNQIDDNAVETQHLDDVDDSTYEVEYIMASDEFIEEHEDSPSNKPMSKHSLLCDSDGNGGETYSCLECGTIFESIDEFTLAHAMTEEDVIDEDVDDTAEMVQETQWEVLDDESMEDTYHDGESKEVVHSKGDECVENIKEETTIIQCKDEDEDEVDDEEQDNEEKFFCMECQIVFGDLESAEQHECVSSNDKDDGSDSNQDPEPSAKKKRVDEKDREFKCLHCPRIFATVNALCSHSRTHRAPDKRKKNQDLVTCDVCNTNFSSLKNLRFHMRMHDRVPTKSIQDALPEGAKNQYSKTNQFYCEICNKSFNENLILIHKNMHQHVDEYICGTCNRQFETMAEHNLHMKLHDDKYANKKKEPPVSKSKHLREGKLSFPCQYCGHEFARPYEKVKHERVHTGEKPYECEVCGKTFRVAYSLTLHLRTHTDIRPYVCPTCNKRFKSQPVYTHHLMTHKAERNFKCDQCPKSFRTAVQLCGHKNSHKKPFVCPVCNRSFSALYAVKVHMKTHEKDYKPGSARRSKKDSNMVKLHCGLCGSMYTRMFALRQHMREQHNVEMEQGHTQHIERVSNSDDDGETFLVTAGADCVADESGNESPPPPPPKQEPERRVMRINKNKKKVGRPPKVKLNEAKEASTSNDILIGSEDIMMDTTYTEEIVDNDTDEWLEA